MHHIRLISEIYRNKWLLEPMFAMQQGPIIASLLNGQTQLIESHEDEDKPKLKCFAVDAATPGVRYRYSSGWDNAPFGSVAIIPLVGTLMKEDQSCGPVGMATIGRIIQQADNHPNIKSIVLHTDSPGGTVDGTETLASIVKSTKKPILTFVDGLMASAALWIGSSSDEVMASTDLDMIGSVGVVMSFSDIQPYFEKLGVKFHTITASSSPDKVKVWEDLRAGNYDNYIKEVLDPIDEKFMTVIRENRIAVEDKHLTGKIFFARDVMGVFVDSIGTLENAIQRASELANAEADKKDHSNNNSQNNMFMKQFENLNAVLQVDNLEAVDDSVSLNEEQLEAIDSQLAQVDTLTNERDTASNERNAAIAAFDAIDPTIASAEGYEAKEAAIRALLAAKPGDVPPGAQSDDDKKTTAEDWATIDSLPHNKAVDQNS